MILVVDGSNMAFRAHCAFPPLTSSEGKHVGAIYGMLKILRTLICSYRNATHVIVTFDEHGSKGRRLAIYDQYKAHREAQTSLNRETYYEQVPYLKKVLALLCPVLSSEALEADDIIAWLADELQQKGVLISSTDRDLYQLVRPNVSIVDAFKKEKLVDSGGELTINSFYSFTGVKPEQYVELRMLTGDSSDNIKGIHGVGPVTATKLLTQYGSIQNMLDAKVEKVVNNLDIIQRNRILMELNFHKSDPTAFEALRATLTSPVKQDLDTLKEVFNYLGFTSFTENFLSWSQPFLTLSRTPILNG